MRNHQLVPAFGSPREGGGSKELQVLKSAYMDSHTLGEMGMDLIGGVDCSNNRTRLREMKAVHVPKTSHRKE